MTLAERLAAAIHADCTVRGHGPELHLPHAETRLRDPAMLPVAAAEAWRKADEGMVRATHANALRVAQTRLIRAERNLRTAVDAMRAEWPAEEGQS
jgi:hypothetical protein